MGYVLEIGAFSNRDGKPRFRSITAGNPTQSHWGPILNALGMNDAGDRDGNWTPVDAKAVRDLDTVLLSVANGIPEELLGDLVELQGDIVTGGNTVQTFVRLAA